MGPLWVALWAIAGGQAAAMQLTPIQKTEMKQHYDKATRAYDIQKYTEAVEEYQKAYEIGGDPAMLYNVAQSYRLNDQLPDAVRFYRRYLQRSPNARNREDVERKIADLERSIEDRRKAMAAAAAAPPPVIVAPAPVAPAPAPKAEESSSSGAMLVTGIVVAVVGVAGLVTGAITGKLASNKAEDLTNASNAPDTGAGRPVFDPKVEDDGKRFEKIAVISAIVGGAALVTGGVLVVLASSPGPSGETTQARHQREAGRGLALAPVFGPGLVGAGASVRF